MWATSAQLAAWALQLFGAYALLLALGLDSRAGIGAAAAVLLAVNVTAVLPATPSNIGVFQLAVITVLTGAYDVPTAAALGYGIILQGVEMATAIAFGLPALIREGLSWRDVRMRALAATPVELSPRGVPVRDACELQPCGRARHSRPTSRSSPGIGCRRNVQPVPANSLPNRARM